MIRLPAILGLVAIAVSVAGPSLATSKTLQPPIKGPLPTGTGGPLIAKDVPPPSCPATQKLKTVCTVKHQSAKPAEKVCKRVCVGPPRSSGLGKGQA
jgi:hypothetical protein